MCLPGLNILSILEIIFYSPAIILSIVLCRRHNFSPNTGFIFLFFFSLLRIAAAALDLATIQYSAPQTTGILETVGLALGFIGLSPLFLTTLGLLYSIRFRMINIYPTGLKPFHLMMMRVPVVVGLVLCGKGAIDYGLILGKTGQRKIDILSKVGTCIFLVITIATTLVTALLLTLRFRFQKTQQRLLYTVAASLPFLLLRVLNGLLGAFTNIEAFTFLGGSVIAYAFMSMLPEMIMVTMYVVVGFLIPPIIKIPKEKKSNSEKQTSKTEENKKRRVVPWKRSKSRTDKKAFRVVVRAADTSTDDTSTVGTVDGEQPILKEKKIFRTSRVNGTLGDHGRRQSSGDPRDYEPTLMKRTDGGRAVPPRTSKTKPSRSKSQSRTRLTIPDLDLERGLDLDIDQLPIPVSPRKSYVQESRKRSRSRGRLTDLELSQPRSRSKSNTRLTKPPPPPQIKIPDLDLELGSSQVNLNLAFASPVSPLSSIEEAEKDDHRTSTRVTINGMPPAMREERWWRKSGGHARLDDVELGSHASVDLSAIFRAQVGRAE